MDEKEQHNENAALDDNGATSDTNAQQSAANAAASRKVNPVTGRPALPRAPKACARCRRQKLRCDPFRPCALCVRACVECVNQNPEEVAETRRANKAKREEKKSKETRSGRGNSSGADDQGERIRSPSEPKGNIGSQSPPRRCPPFEGEPPRKRPKYIEEMTGSFPMPEFSISGEDAERYSRRRDEGSLPGPTSFSFDDREPTSSGESSTKREGSEEPVTTEKSVRQRNSEIVTELNRVRPFPDGHKQAEGRIRQKIGPEITLSARENEEAGQQPGMRHVVGGTSAIGLTREVFAIHNKGGVVPPSVTFGPVGGETKPPPQHQRRRRNVPPIRNSHRQSVMAQLMLLPSKSLTDFLIETYILSVHWFICCLHEPTFRKRYEELMQCREEVLQAKERMVADEDGGGQQRQHAKLISLSERVESDENFTFTMLILSVCLLGAQYTLHSPAWQEKMNALQPEKSSAKVKLDPIMARLSARIKLHMLDIVSLGDLSSVSICIIIGSYYLFLGEPNMSWPILGCAIKVAQTLTLHRALQDAPPPGYTKTSWLFEQQLRRRVWWALHVYDRFAAMVYGRPLGINDDDCDVGLPFNIDDDKLPPMGNTDREIFSDSQLVTLDPRILGPHTSHAREVPHLFTYAHKKCGIYYIIGEAMRALYRLNGRTTPHQRTEPIRPSADPSKVQELIASVAALDKRLKQWYDSVPPLLKDISTKPISGVDEKTERTYKLQALALQLAFDSAVILIHRPMLGYQVSSYRKSSKLKPTSPDPFRSSAEECWHAALRTSMISRNPGLYEQIQSTHAVSFLGIHLFNAGVVLCISAINEPVSIRSHEAKLGVGRILAMQKGLFKQTPIAKQGSQILQDLVRLVMNREMESIFVSGGEMKGSSNGSISSVDSGEEDQQLTEKEDVRMENSTEAVQQAQAVYPMMTRGDEAQPNPAMSFASFSPGFDVVENQAVNQTLLDLEKVMDNSTYDLNQPPQTQQQQQQSPPLTEQPSPANFNQSQTPLSDPNSWSSNNTLDMQSPGLWDGTASGGNVYMPYYTYGADWSGSNSGGGGQGFEHGGSGVSGAPLLGGSNAGFNVLDTGQTWMWGAHRL